MSDEACDPEPRRPEEQPLDLTAMSQAQLRAEATRLVERVREGHHHEARARFDALVAAGWRPSQQECERLVIAWADAHRAEDADAVYRHMATVGVVPTAKVLRALVSAWSFAHRPRRAQDVLDLMVAHGHRPGPNAYQAVMAAWARTGNAAEVQALWARMAAAGVAANRFHHRYLAQALAKARQSEEAREALGQMRAAGWQPGRFEYGALADAYGRLGEAREAESLLEQMAADGVEADAAIHAAVVAAWAHSPTPEGAAGAFARAREHVGADADLYWGLIRAEARSGGVRAAEAVLAAMTADGVVPERRHVRVAVGAACQEGALDTALRLLEEGWSAGGVDPRTCHDVLRLAALHRDAERALRLVEAMWRRGPHPEAAHYEALVDACTEAGRPSAAERALADMAARHLAPAAELVAKVAEAWERAGQGGRARRLRQRYRDSDRS